MTFDQWNSRFNGSRDFYACVDSLGNWFDSSELFSTAVHWCCCDAGHFDMTTEEELEWLNNNKFYSVIHCTLLKQMYDAGLIQ